jgi:hypothetical protein
MNIQDEDIELQLQQLEEETKRQAALQEATRKLLQQVRDEKQRRLNDPKERAKMLQAGSDMFDAGVKEYLSKGIVCVVERDENNIITNILFNPKKSGNRVPRKKAGEVGFVPVMTNETFAEIYNDLGEEFNNKNIITALAAKSKEGYTDFKTQPALSKILKDGYKTIRFSKIGIKGRGVKYKKVLQAQ